MICLIWGYLGLYLVKIHLLHISVHFVVLSLKWSILPLFALFLVIFGLIGPIMGLIFIIIVIWALKIGKSIFGDKMPVFLRIDRILAAIISDEAYFVANLIKILCHW